MVKVICVLLAGAALLLAGCTSKTKQHRLLGPEQEVCNTVLALGARNRESGKETGENPAQCYLQAHVTPDPRDGRGTWDDVAASVDRLIYEPTGYRLGFVEIADGGELHEARQLLDLAAHLRAERAEGRQNYVVVFVHGWRHDASLRDNDVRKFRVMLGYARAALNSRCVAMGAYCDASLTGVFVGWRGRSFVEPLLPADDGFNPFSLLAAPTLGDRKRQSDELGTGGTLARILDTIQDTLSLRAGSVRADKMLIFGHSLGGNMLASLMEIRASAAMDNHVHGQQMKAPAGDLVVLLNPASEARKWHKVQDQMRARVGFGRQQNYLHHIVDGQENWDVYRRLRRWREMFAITQRPVYLSITATDDWSGFESNGRRIAYDSATGRLFPLAQRVRGLDDPEDQTAIGHFTTTYRTAKTLEGAAIGASHEFSVNQGTGKRANYRLSGSPRVSWCDPARGWLLGAREQQKRDGWSHGEKWDYGLSPSVAEGSPRAAQNIARGLNNASVQWRHGLNLSKQPDRWSVVSGHSPFWNVRALDTAVREHAGYVNYPMWCAIQQLVLDDVVSPRTPAPVVEAMQEAEAEAKAAKAQETQPGSGG